MNNTALVLRQNGEEILKIWERTVTKEVSAAKETSIIVLYDHLPNIITDIADIMERQVRTGELAKDDKYLEILENSKHHGRHRATTSHYTVEQVIHEYIIFHRVITEFLKLKNGYDEEVSDLLKYVIETSILKSVGAFSHSIQEMQEKLVGTIAHDIRNPLAAAQLSLEMIKQDQDGKWADKMRDAAERSVRKAINLIEGLMDGIKAQAGEGMLLRFEEKNILKDIQFFYEDANEIYVNELKLKYDSKPIIGVFDGIAVRRLLENVVGNAVKYGDPHLPITISVEDFEEKLKLSVHNHGNPIPEIEKKRIFEFLARDKQKENDNSKSWGMGLTLSQMVVEAHGGSLELISNIEKGTEFTATLFKNFNKPGKRRTTVKNPVLA